MLLDHRGDASKTFYTTDPSLLGLAVKSNDFNFVKELLTKYKCPHSCVRRKDFS